MGQIAPLLLAFALIFSYGLGVGLAIYALLPDTLGWRQRGVLIVPAVAAVLLLVTLVLLFPAHSANVTSRLASGGLAAAEIHLSMLASWGLAAGALVAAAIATYFAAHAIPLGVSGLRRWRDGGRRGQVADIVRSVMVAGVLVATLGATLVTRNVVSASSRASALAQVVSEHPLPGSPTGLSVDASSGTGYITLGEGRILRFELNADGSSLDLEQVAAGLSFPRGPAVIEGELVLSDLGEVGCPNAFPQCWTADPEEELRRLEASSAKVVAFRIEVDGLGPPRDVVTNLPVVNTEHAPNSITAGPDGYLYMPIGGVDRLPFSPELIDQIQHPNARYLGTVVRFAPSDPELEVVAVGTRNIYSLAFNPDGRIFGIDNDGQAVRGWRHENLFEIRPGEDYGFPYDGTFGEDVPRPVWILSEAAAAAVAWADIGNLAGVLIGVAGDVVFVPLGQDNQGIYVANEQDVRTVVTGLGGFVSAIQPLGGARFVATVFDPLGARNALIVLELSGTGV